MNRGVALLMVVIVVSAAALVMVLGSLLLGIGAADSAFINGKAGEVLAFTEGCMDNALERLRIDDAYAGETLVRAGASCVITISGSGTARSIVVAGTIDSYNKKIKVEATLTPAVRGVGVLSWQERTD